MRRPEPPRRVRANPAIGIGPHEARALMRVDPAAALRARMELRAALTESFAQGLRITGFDTGAAAYHLR